MNPKTVTDIVLYFDDGSTEHLMENGHQTVEIRARELLERYIDSGGVAHDTARTIISLGDNLAFVLPPVQPAEGIHIIEDVPDDVIVIN